MRGLDAKEQAEMIEQMKKMNEEMGDDFLPTPQTSTPQAKKPSVAKAHELKVAEFTLERDDNEGLLQLAVSVPGLDSMKGVELDVTDSLASIVFPSSVKLKPLKVELPASVVPSSVKAKFSKKTSQITVKLPLLLKVAKAG